MKTSKILLFSLLLSTVFLPAIYSQNSEDYYDDDRDHQNEWYDVGWQRGVIRNGDFTDLKKVINDRWFESTKLEFAKRAIS